MKNIFLLSIIFLTYSSTMGQSLIVDAGEDRHLCSLNKSVNQGNVVLGGEPTVSNGTPPYSYEWSFEYGGGIFKKTASEVLTDSSLANPELFLFSWENDLNVPFFKLKVTDSNGMIGYDSVKVTISDFGESFDYWDIFLDKGDSILLNNGVNIGGGIGNPTYSWTPSEGIISENNQISIWVKPSENINYKPIIEDELGCKATGNVYYFVHVNPVSVVEYLGNNGFKCYQDNDNILVYLSNNEVPKQISIFDLNGIEVNKVKNQSNINALGLSSGYYLLCVSATNKKFSKKIYVRAN